MHAMRIVGPLFLLLTAGCAGVERTPTESSEPPPRWWQSSHPNPAPPTRASPKQNYRTPVFRQSRPRNRPQKNRAPRQAPRRRTASPPLDLTTLETRLKETKAIGVFTKITLKNQVDDLLEQFRAYYQGRAKTTLAELRQPYDRLLLKVLSLLQDGDPELARTIVTSREAIWGILADPNKFATL